MLIGSHVSVAGGYINGLTYAQEVGAECIQFFAKSPRQWKGPKLDPDGSAAFVAMREELDFGPVFTHTAYLLNLSTDNLELVEKSIAALADELVRAALCKADGVVLHIGNDPLGDDDAAAVRAAGAIRASYELAGDIAATTRLLIENTAGGGSSFGANFTQLAAIIDATGRAPEHLGICLDTCHAFAYGMPLDSKEGWQEVIAEIAEKIGLDRLGLIHANDCMFERGSKRDRHAWIGEGNIGYEGFFAMVCAKELDHVPVVSEMPGDKPIKDIENITRLMKLRYECA